MKKQLTALMILSMLAVPVMAQSLDNQAFEAQVFHSETAQPMQLGELSAQEMRETEGAWVANAAGGFMGGVGGHFGYMANSIASGRYNRNEHLASVAGGAALGFVNPIRGGASLIKGMSVTAAGVGVGGATGYFGSRGRDIRFR